MTSSTIERARHIRTKNFGDALCLHSVIYPIDYCTSGCTYCGLSTLLAQEGAHGVRGAMPPATFDYLIHELADAGYRVHELVFGTVAVDQAQLTKRVVRWVQRARAAHPESYLIVNCDTLHQDGYHRLKDAGADAVWTFIEVMSPDLYARKHRHGLKADQAERREAPQRIRDAGMAVGNALLWGLAPDWRAEFDQFVAWSTEVGGFDFVATPVQRTITLPEGTSAPEGFDIDPPLSVSPDLYLDICARLRLAFPDSHLVANTRLDPGFVYGRVSEIADMCNGYVWTGARSHPSQQLVPVGHVKSDTTQMNFYNPGADPATIQRICPPGVTVDLNFRKTPHSRNPAQYGGNGEAT
jgi:biotin synthase-like enzyme